MSQGNPLARLGSAPDAYQAQMEGDYERAVELYQSSLETFIPPLKHTLSLAGPTIFKARLDEAIAECKRAIEIDPEFGKSLQRHRAPTSSSKTAFNEAIPWLERAVEAARYEPRHFPHYNLGRATWAKKCTLAP